MQFYSFLFVFLFLPCSLIGYFLLNRIGNKWGSYFLILMNLVFYGWTSWKYLLYFVSCILINYIIVQFIINHRKTKVYLIIGLFYNISSLLYLKYCNFFVDTLQSMLKKDINFSNLFLPLGISFFTFQFIALIVDCYKGEIKKITFEKYVVFVSYFPKIIQGPITLYQNFEKQYSLEENHRFNASNFSKGMYALSLGFAKKILIADGLGNFVNAGFGGGFYSYDSLTLIFLVVSYTFQIYFDFSGYSDMARGISYMFNIELPINFNSPYKAISINDFWKRWHMSLTNFFTRYLYIPLGGNRKGNTRMMLNIGIVFFVSGLWHGANYTFIVWGILHGIASVCERKIQNRDKINVVLRWMFTFAFINLTWIFFRANTISDALVIIKGILRCDFSGVNTLALALMNNSEISFILSILGIRSLVLYLPYIFILVLFIGVMQFKNTDQKIEKFEPSITKCLVTISLLSWSILSFGNTVSFIYERF